MSSTDAGSGSRSVIEIVLHGLQSLVCSLRGHDPVLQYDRTRMYLRCTSCGHETPGWEVGPAATVAHRRTERTQLAGSVTVVRKIA